MRITLTPDQFKPWVTDLSHEELIEALQIMHPGSEHGRDYVVAHPVAAGSAQRTGPAQIVAWNLPGDIPHIDDHVGPVWAQHGHTIRHGIAAKAARRQRSALLAEADILVNKAQDSNDDAALAKARAYRQALRDISKQPGFPANIDWPAKP